MELEADFKLNRADRCDECGAQAYYLVEVNGSILMFCGHHATKYETKFMAKGYEFRDFRYLLDPVHS